MRRSQPTGAVRGEVCFPDRTPHVSAATFGTSAPRPPVRPKLRNPPARAGTASRTREHPAHPTARRPHTPQDGPPTPRSRSRPPHDPAAQVNDRVRAHLSDLAVSPSSAAVPSRLKAGNSHDRPREAKALCTGPDRGDQSLAWRCGRTSGRPLPRGHPQPQGHQLRPGPFLDLFRSIRLCPRDGQASGEPAGLRASIRKRVVWATKGPSLSIRSCSCSSRSRYWSTVKPGTIQITFRRK